MICRLLTRIDRSSEMFVHLTFAQILVLILQNSCAVSAASIPTDTPRTICNEGTLIFSHLVSVIVSSTHSAIIIRTFRSCGDTAIGLRSILRPTIRTVTLAAGQSVPVSSPMSESNNTIGSAAGCGRDTTAFCPTHTRRMIFTCDARTWTERWPVPRRIWQDCIRRAARKSGMRICCGNRSRCTRCPLRRII